MEMKNRIIAVDFDGTLCEDKWPDIGAPNWPVIRKLRRAQALGGAKVILWTCRDGQKLSDAVTWCAIHGIRLDAVNANLPDTIAQFGSDPRKISATEYWDDRAIRVEWEELDT